MYITALPSHICLFCSRIYLFARPFSMNRTTDLRKHGEKSVLVKKQGVAIEEDVLKNFIKFDDDRVSWDILPRPWRSFIDHEERLLKSFALPALLNPVFGTRAKVFGSGLMTSNQYCRARQEIMQDHLVTRSILPLSLLTAVLWKTARIARAEDKSLVID